MIVEPCARGLLTEFDVRRGYTRIVLLCFFFLFQLRAPMRKWHTATVREDKRCKFLHRPTTNARPRALRSSSVSRFSILPTSLITQNTHLPERPFDKLFIRAKIASAGTCCRRYQSTTPLYSRNCKSRRVCVCVCVRMATVVTKCPPSFHSPVSCL